MMKREELLKMFESAGAIRHGHFELSSGLHSAMYVQCALVLQYPRFAEALGQDLAEKFAGHEIEAVVSPAIGGLIIGQEVARALPEPRQASAGDAPSRRGSAGDFCGAGCQREDEHAAGIFAAARAARAGGGRCVDHRGIDARGDSGGGRSRRTSGGGGCADRSKRREDRSGCSSESAAGDFHSELCGGRLSFVPERRRGGEAGEPVRAGAD